MGYSATAKLFVGWITVVTLFVLVVLFPEDVEQLVSELSIVE